MKRKGCRALGGLGLVGPLIGVDSWGARGGGMQFFSDASDVLCQRLQSRRPETITQTTGKRSHFYQDSGLSVLLAQRLKPPPFFFSLLLYLTHPQVSLPQKESRLWSQ